MNDIVGVKFGQHDGSVCCLRDGQLLYSVEAEKDSNPRYATCSFATFNAILSQWATQPSLICGDAEALGGHRLNYWGIEHDSVKSYRISFRGRQLEYLSVPHEMCHIASAFALSDLADGDAFYALVWEGCIGSMYHVDQHFNIKRLGDAKHVLENVGIRYVLPYYVTGRTHDIYGHAAAGRIMALAGMERNPPDDDGELAALVGTLLDSCLTTEGPKVILDGDPTLPHSALGFLKGIPVYAPAFTRVCRAIQDGIFSRFHQFARAHVHERLPLLISGGCGLNCNWNTRWSKSGLFSSVFVPPVANDSGIAIGAAVIGQRLRTGRAKLKWNVYAGQEFVDDAPDSTRFGLKRKTFGELCRLLTDENGVVAWVSGRCEIGPRALCNRSLLAAPFQASMRDRLNRIKHRDHFRPVAPVCREEDVQDYFEWSGPSAYMLHFQDVRSAELKAVTHYDGTARVQTVTETQHPQIHGLLSDVKARTGVGVLCNTSLNFPGRGFINRMSELVEYAKRSRISGIVVNGDFYAT